MDENFVIYQMRAQLWQMTYENWLQDLTSFHYWGAVTFIIVYYIIWWRLTDKRRLSDLLLFGSLVSIIRFIIDALAVNSGLWYYQIHIIPLASSIFIHNLTIIPLTFMFAQQHSPGWKRFFLNAAYASVLIAGVIFPLESWLGIIVFMKWNYINSFFGIYLTAIFSRAAFNLVKQIQCEAIEGYNSTFQGTLAQPAFKPTNENNKEGEK